MRTSSTLFALVVAAFSATAQADQFNAAMADLKISDPHGDRELSGYIWYPTDAAGPLTSAFESAVWVEPQVIRDATPADGRFPMVVLSHGMYGNALNQAWLASALANQGYVVAAINHPGTSTWSRDPDVTRQLWERPKDVSRVIDHVTKAPDLSRLVDLDRVFMAGHSLGGFTAIALAGARYDAARLTRFCRETPGELACSILSDWKIAHTAQDREKMEGDLSDPRIKAFAVFDLGGTQSFSDESLARIDRRLLVFGAPIMNSGLTLDIEARALRDAVAPGIITYLEPENLSHFDFLGLCKPDGYGILAREIPGDEVVCENGSELREDKHRMVIAEVLRFFSQN